MSGSDLAETVRKFIAPFTDPVFSELGAYVADKIKFMRFNNCVNVLIKAQEILKERGINPRPVDPKVIIPLLENASLESDESMVDKWAKLLAAASTDSNITPAFPAILAQLATREANILEWLYDEQQRLCSSMDNYVPAEGIVIIRQIKDQFGLTQDESEIIIDNLLRLRLIKTSGIFDTSNPILIRSAAEVSFTTLGAAFIRACKGATY